MLLGLAFGSAMVVVVIIFACLSLQKSSIGGNQYLAYLWESGWLSLYI
jgi:hypothetical protein